MLNDLCKEMNHMDAAQYVRPTRVILVDDELWRLHQHYSRNGLPQSRHPVILIMKYQQIRV
jgi:hypothetical protein